MLQIMRITCIKQKFGRVVTKPFAVYHLPFAVSFWYNIHNEEPPHDNFIFRACLYRGAGRPEQLCFFHKGSARGLL